MANKSIKFNDPALNCCCLCMLNNLAANHFEELWMFSRKGSNTACTKCGTVLVHDGVHWTPKVEPQPEVTVTPGEGDSIRYQAREALETCQDFILITVNRTPKPNGSISISDKFYVNSKPDDIVRCLTELTHALQSQQETQEANYGGTD